MAAIRWVIPFEEHPPQNGACVGHPTDWWFPERYATGAKAKQVIIAKQICAGCDSRVECLDYAISSVEQYGIWGGLSVEARDVIARERKVDGTLKLFTKIAVREPHL